jgi:hypothetical protein
MIRFCPILHSCSLSLFLCFLTEADAVEESVQNVDFTVQDTKVHISYALVGEGEYTVTLHLSQEGRRTFTYRPRSVSGDVGSEIRPGRGKKIVWDAQNDMGQLEGKGFVFEIRAVRPRELSKWVWLAGAGVGAVGAATAMTLTGEDKEDKGTILIDIQDPGER